jgi:hypothetical protein
MTQVIRTVISDSSSLPGTYWAKQYKLLLFTGKSSKMFLSLSRLEWLKLLKQQKHQSDFKAAQSVQFSQQTNDVIEFNTYLSYSTHL